jgi:hypothetical protein
MASIRSATFFAANSSASSPETSLLAADPAVLEAVVLLAAPPQPVSTPAQRARAVRAAAALWMVRFLIFVRSFPVFEHDFC